MPQYAVQVRFRDRLTRLFFDWQDVEPSRGFTSRQAAERWIRRRALGRWFLRAQGMRAEHRVRPVQPAART